MDEPLQRAPRYAALESLLATDLIGAVFECSSDMRAIVGSAPPAHSNR
jgi:hypothetical protein